jgi:hypothetical protein
MTSWNKRSQKKFFSDYAPNVGKGKKHYQLRQLQETEAQEMILEYAPKQARTKRSLHGTD